MPASGRDALGRRIAVSTRELRTHMDQPGSKSTSPQIRPSISEMRTPLVEEFRRHREADRRAAMPVRIGYGELLGSCFAEAR
jgi:hypothetical protein